LEVHITISSLHPNYMVSFALPMASVYYPRPHKVDNIVETDKFGGTAWLGFIKNQSVFVSKLIFEIMPIEIG
jgi:hypothetical protein